LTLKALADLIVGVLSAGNLQNALPDKKMQRQAE